MVISFPPLKVVALGRGQVEADMVYIKSPTSPLPPNILSSSSHFRFYPYCDWKTARLNCARCVPLVSHVLRSLTCDSLYRTENSSAL